MEQTFKFSFGIKWVIFLTVLFVFFQIGVGQSYHKQHFVNKNADSLRKIKTIEFYKWGMPDFGYQENYLACEDSLQRKYGFYYRTIAGCVVTAKKVRKWRRHNKKCDRIMIRRHGKNWRQEYNNAFDSCYLSLSK